MLHRMINSVERLLLFFLLVPSAHTLKSPGFSLVRRFQARLLGSVGVSCLLSLARCRCCRDRSMLKGRDHTDVR